MGLAAPQFFSGAVNEEHSAQALAKLLAVLHVAVRHHALVVVRQVDEHQLRFP